MSEIESLKKMLRSVLQSSKAGVSVTSLQSEYRSLCGESIPLKKLGFSKLEDFLRSIPSVVRLEHHMGELRCFATACQETAHIAELVAKQRSSKKSGRSQVINCRMRFKPSNPYMLKVRPRSSLRQPSAGVASSRSANCSQPHGGYSGFSASGDYRKEKSLANCQKPREKPLEQLLRPNPSQSSLYDLELMQSRIAQLLKKHCSGLWLSKISEVYSEMFSQKLQPQVLGDLEKWTNICMVEQPSCNNRADRLVYPSLLPKPFIVPTSSSHSSPPASPINSSAVTIPISSSPLTPDELFTPLPSSPVPKPRVSPKSPLAKPTFIFSPQPVTASSDKKLFSVTLHSPVHNTGRAPQLPPCTNLAVNANDGCKDNQNMTTAVSAEVRQKMKELLSKYSHGLWAHALPKLFISAYKMPFPEDVLENLSPLMDICSVEYPMPNDKKKAILYKSSRADMEAKDSQESQQRISHPLPSGLKVLGCVIPPCLVLPSEQYPSVLITDAKGSNAVTIRYVGVNYSDAQEAMEDAMRSFYSQDSTFHHLSNPVVGQLVAVRGEEGDELARAQVMELMAPDKVKVYYVDYGFSVETSESNLLELHQDFLCLPFQATNVRLAGLETFSSKPLVLSSLDKFAIGKILLMETLEPCQQNEKPVVVLYDTSQDDDINVNSIILKTLQDKTMNNPLTVNVTYRDSCVTNVCADGIIYCQLPSRGIARLRKLLGKVEVFFNSQTSSESLVSRPFNGKFCLACYKGNMSRVEITNMYSNRVIEILFIDLGIQATVEVTDLREIPPVFLKDLIIIPPQAIKCCLADLKVPEKDWNPEAVLCVKEAVLASEDCKIKILRLGQHKGERLVYIHLFIGTDNQKLDNSVNHQLDQSELWQRLTTQNNNTITSRRSSMDTGVIALVEKWTLSSSDPVVKASTQSSLVEEDSPLLDTNTKTLTKSLPMPPPLELPQPGQNIDVFVPVACNPGYFVLQPCKDMHKLVVLMGEMILYYNQTWTTKPTTHIQAGDVCAARIDKNWHRVQVNGVLTSGLVSVYELDYGKHELVHSNVVRPLLEEFRQLPFQAITAQLAGVTQHQWSEEASMLFRNYVEKRSLVAQVETVQEVSQVKGELWQSQLTVYLVDTSLEDRDLWIHSIMADIDSELSSAT